MRPSDVDWRLLRGAIILLVISALVAGAALAASHSFTGRQDGALQRERSAFMAARSQYHALDEEEDIIATYLPRYLALEEAGIIGREQRLDWIDVLREAGRAARVQSLSYVLNAQQRFEPGMALSIGDYAVYVSSMRVDIGLLHEGDLLEFLDRLRNQMPGLFGVNGCRMMRTDPTLRLAADAVNVEVRCQLNFYTLRKPESAGERELMRALRCLDPRLAVLVLAICGAAPPAEAQRLGRLFTSVDERAQLDELRYQAQYATPQPEPEPAPAATRSPEQAAPAVSSLTVNGIVRGSGGRGTVWVNGNRIERGGTTREGIQVNTAGPGGRSVRARLPSGVDTIEIKPGQKIDVIHGVVLEPYERSENTPIGPSAFELDAGRAGPTPAADPAAPAALPASGAAPGGAATGAQRDAAAADVLQRALDAMPAPETLTPEGRAQAEVVRRQLERAAAGNAPAKP